MSNQFARYEQDLTELIKSAKIILADKVPLADQNQKKTLLRQAEKNVEEMNSMISEMEFELNKFGPNSRMSVSNKIKQFKLDVELVQKDIRKAQTELNKYKTYDSINPSTSSINDPERRKALQIHQSLANTGESIIRSTQIAIETEQIGNEVLGELNDQGEQLRRVNTRLDDTKVALSKSRRLINKLSRGVFYNKCLLVVIIILEIIALGGVIYWKFIA